MQSDTVNTSLANLYLFPPVFVVLCCQMPVHILTRASLIGPNLSELLAMVFDHLFKSEYTVYSLHVYVSLHHIDNLHNPNLFNII